MAIRLEKAGWSSADHWLRLQTAFDLAEVRKRQDSIVRVTGGLESFKDRRRMTVSNAPTHRRRDRNHAGDELP